MSVRVMQAMAGARHGGAETFFVRLALALAQAGLEQRLVIRPDPAREAVLREAGVSFATAPFGGRADFFTAKLIRREAGAFRPQVVLTWMNRASRQCPDGDHVRVARLGGYYDLKYYRKCDHLIGNTRDIVRYLVAAGWPKERVHYLPNFVPGGEARPLPRGDLDTPEDVPVLLALGRLHGNKAFDVLIRALAAIPDAVLWLAGEGPEEAGLRELAATTGVAGRVRFAGWRDDAEALLAAADLLVCPSRHEPLGNVVIEGWAAGKPVVAAASAGPAGLIRDGANGILAIVDDAAALAVAINRVLGDRGLAEELAAGGRESWRGEYTREAVVARYMDFFAGIAA